MKTYMHIELSYLEKDYKDYKDYNVFFQNVHLNNVFESIPLDLIRKSTLVFDGFSLKKAGDVVYEGGVVTYRYNYTFKGTTIYMDFRILFEDLDKCEKFCEILKNNGFES